MNRNNRGFLINLVLCLSFAVIAIGQNPFEIKTPGKKEEKTVINNAPTLPQNKQPDTPPKPPSSSNTESSSSNNPFDIKAGAGNQPTSILNQPSVNENSTIRSPNATPSEIKPTIPPITSDGVNNPFNIKAGTDPSSPSISNSANTPSVAAPVLKDIKNQIEEFKSGTSETQGGISKNTWFVIYIFLVLLAGIAINFNRSYPLALMKATYNQNQMRILFKDAFKGNHTFIFGILYFLFIVNAGIFLYQSFLIFNITKISLLFAIFIVFITYLIRHLVLFVMGVIFPLTKEASLFSYTIGIYNLALGIALLFLNSALLFVDPETGKMLIFSGLSIIVVLYILRQIRGLLSIVPSILTAKFHFIIYLCTVEIAPWLLLSGILLK